MVRTASLIVLVLAGCAEDPKFPASIPDANYYNGHALSRNTVEGTDGDWEQALVDVTNDRRVQEGLAPLARSFTLDALARAQSLHMQQHYFFNHLNPEGDLESSRLGAFTKAPVVMRENIWIVEPGKTPQEVLDGFMASPGHRDNLLAYGHLIGVGIVRRPYNSIPDHIYVTMEFVELR